MDLLLIFVFILFVSLYFALYWAGKLGGTYPIYLSSAYMCQLCLICKYLKHFGRNYFYYIFLTGLVFWGFFHFIKLQTWVKMSYPSLGIWDKLIPSLLNLSWFSTCSAHLSSLTVLCGWSTFVCSCFHLHVRQNTSHLWPGALVLSLC